MALALGLPLSAVLSLSAAELAFWQEYRELHGFPADRIEAAAANGLAYVGATWGGKARPADLAFRPARRAASREAVRAWFDSLTPDKFPTRNVQ